MGDDGLALEFDFLTPLYPYQLEGAEFLLANKNALLADQMGVGKTPQAVHACRDLNKVLVICPTTAKVNWQREFMKFGDRHAFVVGEKKRTHKTTNKPNTNVVITHYERIVRDIEKYKRVKWDVVVYDEIHYVKEPGSKRAAALFGSSGIIHHTQRNWCLTGTPAPNHAGELWVMMYTFGLTTLSYDGFVDRYCTTMHVKDRYCRPKVTGTGSLHIHEVKKSLAGFSLRRLLADVMPDMPPISYNTVVVESKENPLKDYPEMMKKVREEWKLLSEKIDMESWSSSDDKILNLLTLLSDSISSLRRYHGLKKAPVVADIIAQELKDNAYKKIIIFGIHSDVLSIIRERLSEFGVATITGAVAQHKRQAEIDRFQYDDDCRVFVGGVNSAGTAITLTAAHQVAFVERDYVPGNNAQAASRAWRISQLHPVVVRFFSLPGFDERVSAILAKKAQEISQFII